jgi:hypothetical protein
MSNNNVSGSGEFRSTDPQQGVIKGRNFFTRAVKYSAIEGNAIFEGDIILSSVEAMQRAFEALTSGDPEALKGVAIVGTGARWPGAIVPYEIDGQLPDSERVTGAIQHWESVTKVRFRQRTTEPDYVLFRPSSGCSSSVGRQGGLQFVNLGPGCTLGNAIHEIGHTLGLWHEQSREDRDNFINVVWENIKESMKHNFDQHIVDGDDIGGYDYGSIMHYPSDAFAIDLSKPTLITPHNEAIGQRQALSAGDIAAINALYP